MTESDALDTIGYWTEVKLDIVKDYAAAYSNILSAQKTPELFHVYIDAFAGPGVAISKSTGEYVPGSPLNALLIDPPFREFFFIDTSQKKLATLKRIIAGRNDVHVFGGDCNSILMERVFPCVRYQDYRRALCLLDPYGLHLNWAVVERAGEMNSIDMFLNFPLMDMNRNVLWHNPNGVAPQDIKRMNRFWGDESWRGAAYTSEGMLFDNMEQKQKNRVIAEAYCKRLREVASFNIVSEPLPMCNSRRAIVYYLIFASQKRVAGDIIDHIFAKYRDWAG